MFCMHAKMRPSYLVDDQIVEYVDAPALAAFTNNTTSHNIPYVAMSSPSKTHVVATFVKHGHADAVDCHSWNIVYVRELEYICLTVYTYIHLYHVGLYI